MDILCTYTGLRPETRDALDRHAPGAEYADVSSSPLAMWEQFRQRWTGETGLMVVEHDVVIHAGVVPAFTSCASAWCTFPYPYNTRGEVYETGAGCARYSAELQRLVPAAEIDQSAHWDGCTQCQPGCWAGLCWHHLDACLVAAFTRHGVNVCLHEPQVGHLHLMED